MSEVPLYWVWQHRPDEPGALYRILVQGYLAHKKHPPYDPTVALFLGTYRDPMGVGVSYERGTPVPK